MLTFDIYTTFASYSLTVIPLFVLMGQVAFHGGISRRLFDAAYHWLGPLPGGLAMATVGACTAFGAICGSGPATTATMAAVALPEMRRYKYSMELACGTVASGGTIGMMIPPSVVFIVYAIMTEQSIGKLFISGILPGILTALLFCVVIYWQCKRRPELGPPAPSTTWKAKVLSLRGMWETLVLFAGRDGRHVLRVLHAHRRRRDRGRRHDPDHRAQTQPELQDARAIVQGDAADLVHGDDHRGRGGRLRPLPGGDADPRSTWRAGWAAWRCRAGSSWV